MFKSQSSIWPIDRILPGATTPGQSEPGSNSNERVLHIPQISKAEASHSHCFMSYPGHYGEYQASAEMQSVYSPAPVDWAIYRVELWAYMDL